MKKFKVSYINIFDEIERTKAVISESQYKAMLLIANEDYRNIITAIRSKEDNEKDDVQ